MRLLRSATKVGHESRQACLLHHQVSFRRPADLKEVAGRLGSLAEEADAAFKTVAAERKFPFAEVPAASFTLAPRELTAEERAEQAKLSSTLWNGGLSRVVKGLFTLLLLVPALQLLGTSGANLGIFPLVIALALVAYAGTRIGRSITRAICADAHATVAEKRRRLFVWFWALCVLLPAGTIAALALARSIWRVA